MMGRKSKFLPFRKVHVSQQFPGPWHEFSVEGGVAATIFNNLIQNFRYFPNLPSQR